MFPFSLQSRKKQSILYSTIMVNFTTDSEFERFRKIIYDRSSIHFSSSNRAVLESRLKERLKSRNLKSVSEYYDMVNSDQEEMRTLLDTVTTNLTRFFRNTSEPHINFGIGPPGKALGFDDIQYFLRDCQARLEHGVDIQCENAINIF